QADGGAGCVRPAQRRRCRRVLEVRHVRRPALEDVEGHAASRSPHAKPGGRSNQRAKVCLKQTKGTMFWIRRSNTRLAGRKGSRARVRRVITLTLRGFTSASGSAGLGTWHSVAPATNTLRI